MEISVSIHRDTINPDDDWSGEPEKVKSVCDALFTDAIKAKWIEDFAKIRTPTIWGTDELVEINLARGSNPPRAKTDPKKAEQEKKDMDANIDNHLNR